MSANVSNARGGNKAARRKKNGEELCPRGASSSAAKAPLAKEIPPAMQATKR